MPRFTTIEQSLFKKANIRIVRDFILMTKITSEDEEANEEKIMSESDFIDKLHSYDLFTLQLRIYNKLFLFTHGIKSNKKSPVELQALIDLPAPADEPAERNFLYSKLYLCFNSTFIYF